jgi:23S rRNA pseudouridine2605 synthase
MRINRYIALSTGVSRRRADVLITDGAVLVNNQIPTSGQDVSDKDSISVSGKIIPKVGSVETVVLLLHKPTGYVCSRDGQGSKTIYDLLSQQYHHLKPVGRLDRDSSGLLLLTNDGTLAHQLTHPSFRKDKTYEVKLDRPLEPLHHQIITDHGIVLIDGPSRFALTRLRQGDDKRWEVRMQEGRNRQIRRTFAALGYQVVDLHRTSFGNYSLSGITPGGFKLA